MIAIHRKNRLQKKEQTDMQSKKIRFFSKDYSVCKALQRRAFPKEEQYPFWQLRLMTLKKGVRFSAFYDGVLFCGIAYTASTERVMYVLYLAVDDRLRSQGYGTKILDLLQAENPEKDIVLNVEPLDERAKNYEQRKKRLAFYGRNGFSDTGYRMTDVTGEYCILSNSERFSVSDYKKAISKIGMNRYKPEITSCIQENEREI